MSSLDGKAPQPGFMFVYGLLMQGFRLHSLLAGAQFLGRATTRGCLVSLGEYPGLLDGDGTVHGELYRFTDIAAALKIVDPIEGFQDEDPEGSLYRRIARTVHFLDGDPRAETAWVYVFNQCSDGAPEIAHGDYREYLASKKITINEP